VTSASHKHKHHFSPLNSCSYLHHQHQAKIIHHAFLHGPHHPSLLDLHPQDKRRRKRPCHHASACDLAWLHFPSSAQAACSCQRRRPNPDEPYQGAMVPCDALEIRRKLDQTARIRQYLSRRAHRDQIFGARIRPGPRKYRSPDHDYVHSLTREQGISNFAILALVITNIWGGWRLQQPRWL
jgi:hypothetical protein